MTPFDQDILVGFFEEATEYLPAIRKGLAAFRRSPTAPDVLEEAHRLVHTIKGASAMVGLAEFSHVAYRLEEVLERLTHEPDAGTPELLADIDRAVDDIEAFLTHSREDGFRVDEWSATAADRVRTLANGPFAFPPASEGGPDDSGSDAPVLDPSFDHLPLPFSQPPQPAVDPADSFPPARHDEDTVTDDLAPPSFASGDSETLPDIAFEVPTFAEPPTPAPEPRVPDVAPLDEFPLPDFAPAVEAEAAPEAVPDEMPVPDFDLPPVGEFAPDDALPVPDFAAGSLDGTSVGPVAPPEEATDDLLDVFRAEAEDHLRALTTLLPEARRDRTDRDRWREIRRAAHTLKGSAAMVGFDDVTRLAHRMEDLLDAYFDGGRAGTRAEIELLVSATDAIVDTVNGRADPAAFEAAHRGLEAALRGTSPEPLAATDPDPLPLPDMPDEAALGAAAAAGAAAAPGATRKDATEATVRVPIGKLNDIVKLFGELVIARTAFEQQVDGFAKLLAEAVDTAERLKRVAGKIEAGFEAKALAGGADGGGADRSGFDALEFDRYTEELAETATDIGTVFGEFGRLAGDLDGHLTRQRRLSSDIEDKLMRLRMVPLSGIEAKLARTVRQAAAASGKAAELAFEGGRTGLDKTVLDAMADPLLHLLRNAVDHGLEPPDVRLALGKPAAGTITLSAGHEGNQVVLTIADDGRGIDFEAVRATAVRRGVVAPAAAAGLTPDDLARVLFEPGFSTRTEVSELSGRGVGLDVVKSKVESLKGTVTLGSVPGRGTTFTVRLPMTLAVARALLVKAAGQTFAIPLDSVEQLLRPDAADLDRVADNPVLRVGGEVFTVVPLAGLLGLPAKPEAGSERPPVVLLHAGGRRIALQVDQLVGGREIVIKSLGKYLRRVPCVSGGTLMGDGSVVLILNPADLAGRGTGRSTLRPATASPVVDPAPSAALTLLVVDDSPSVRRVLSGLGQRAGWDVHTAKDGLDALEILQHRAVRPDVVLTDVEMPRMDGYELLGTIRGQSAFAHLPVAMLTSRSGEKHRRKALELGASAYVVKPYQDADLVEIIRQLAVSGVSAGGSPAAPTRSASPQLVGAR